MRLRTFPRRALRRLKAIIRWESRLNDWEARRFDRKLGVETGGWIEPADLTVPAGDVAEGFTYGGTQARLVRWCFSPLPPSRGSFTFVDMGSGKGRVLLYAAQAGFRRCLGVEFAEELHVVALANAEIAKESGLTIEPVLGDAAKFEFPEEPIVVYFNNPFSERVMEQVIANLRYILREPASAGRPRVPADDRGVATMAADEESRALGRHFVPHGSFLGSTERPHRPAHIEAVHRSRVRVARGQGPLDPRTTSATSGATQSSSLSSAPEAKSRFSLPSPDVSGYLRSRRA